VGLAGGRRRSASPRRIASCVCRAKADNLQGSELLELRARLLASDSDDSDGPFGGAVHESDLSDEDRRSLLFASARDGARHALSEETSFDRRLPPRLPKLAFPRRRLAGGVKFPLLALAFPRPEDDPDEGGPQEPGPEAGFSWASIDDRQARSVVAQPPGRQILNRGPKTAERPDARRYLSPDGQGRRRVGVRSANKAAARRNYPSDDDELLV